MINRSIAIGVIAAIVLSYLRGGISDSFTALVIFGLAGFFASLFLSWLFRAASIHTIEIAFDRLPYSKLIRSVVSFLVALSLLYWSDPFIRSGGYGGWLIAILLSFLAPLIVCIIAPRFSIAFGVFTATCITGSLIFSVSRLEIAHGNESLWDYFWTAECFSYVAVWFVAVALSLLTSVPIHFQRKTSEKNFETPGYEFQLPANRASRFQSTLKIIAVVAVPMLMILGAMRLDKTLDRLRAEYFSIRNHHNGAVNELVEAEHGEPITTLSEHMKLEKVYSLANPKISWHRDMIEKYERAYNYPWFPVSPDERPPER